MKYYLKKLAKQELGVKADGTIARGRYIYISKASADFFPHLSKAVTNDNVLIPIIPPFSDEKVYSTYVYHNDKHNTPDGTRDEFRLYLNRGLDPERSYFHVNDIVVFERVETKSPVPLYITYKFSIGETHYSELDALITESNIMGGALVENTIEFLPHRELNLEEATVVIPQEVMKEAVIQQQEVLASESQGVEETRGASLFGPDSFRDFVLLAYGYKCAITGKVIKHKNLSNLEAAHIQPKAQAGTFLPCNGIALSRDMHWAFDKGFISINDDFTIKVHDVMKDSILKEYAGKPIFIPVDPYFQPEKKFLKHHREKIFGLFLYSGSIRGDR